MTPEEKDTKKDIVRNDIVQEMRTSYLDYAMSVIVARALPDVRDGLKPVHRRILYAMHKLGLTHGAKFRKCAGITGEVLANYHPHGETAVYDALARLAQDFNMRHPLVDGQGNFGSVDGDPPAANRYTEARMSALAEELLRDIEKETVDLAPNYDNRLEEPTVLPAAFPQLLVNGTLGIAVGMATNIPPHNLGEVIDATTHLIEHPDASIADLMEFVKGPDFPTGGVMFNKKDIAHAYATGRGGVVVRGEAEIVEAKGGYQIVIHSIPYQVNKAELIIRIADLVREKRLDGVRDLRDESDKDGLRIAIDLKAGANPQNILNNLYKKTDIERTFHFNMIALVDGIQPQLLSLHEILTHFIEHRRVVITRRTKFDLARAEARAHILEGLKKALDHIDAIVKAIKSSADRDVAHAALMKQFGFTGLQANAILELRLAALAGLERKKIENELAEKLALIKELQSILASPKKLMGVVKTELVALREKYGDKRKTSVVARAAESLSYEDLVPEEDAVMIITRGGYIKRVSPETYRTQRRGGKGVMDMNTKEEDFITILMSGNTHDDVFFFTDRGKVYQEKFYTIPEGKRTTRGKSIVNFLPLATDETVTSVLVVPKDVSRAERSANASHRALILVTKRGIIKKTNAAAFEGVRRSGIIAMTLDKGDELHFARLVGAGDRIIIATKKGQSIFFSEKDARAMGRTAAGVRAIKLANGDEVVGADVAKKEDVAGRFLLTMTAKGYGKRTALSQYRLQKRAGSGIKTAHVTPKTGDVMAAQVLGAEYDEVIAMSRGGQVIRTEVKEIPALGRATQGVRIMKLPADDSLATLACF